MIDASIFGGTGYTGGELIRLLLDHPGVQLSGVYSGSRAGTPVSAVHEHLRGRTDQEFLEEDLKRAEQTSDILLFALPHGESAERVQKVNRSNTRVIDLSADFRLNRPSVYEEAYDEIHAAPDLLEEAVYGLTEHNREQIADAELVACPGCFPTGSLLALLPLVEEEVLSSDVIIDAKTGSSGSGSTPSQTTHHPERSGNFRAYGLFDHRHRFEMEQETNRRHTADLSITFTPHSAPMRRGIFTTAYVRLTEDLEKGAVQRMYQAAYEDEPFVRRVNRPETRNVSRSNFCDIGLSRRKNRVIITSAIDNLVKGASGQAVQNLNVMFGREETEGLKAPGHIV